MPRGKRLTILLAFTIVVSAFGLFTVLTLALYPPVPQEKLAWRKPLVGSIFVLICTSGAIAVLMPKRCSEMLAVSRAIEPASVGGEDPHLRQVHVNFQGHHPDCGRFSAHIVRTNKHVLCAACTGLFLGALAALAAATLYFFLGLDIGQAGLPAVLLGLVGTALGLIQFKAEGLIRLMVNAFFVFAAFLTLVGVDKLVMDLFVDLYSIILICFWLLTRITVSQWDHWRICHKCKTRCMLKEREDVNI